MLLFQIKTNQKEGAKVGGPKAINPKVVKVGTNSLTMIPIFTGLATNTNIEVFKKKSYLDTVSFEVVGLYLWHIWKDCCCFIGFQDPDISPDKRGGHGGGRGKAPAGKLTGPKPKPGGRGRGRGKDPQLEPQTSNKFVVISGVFTCVLLLIPTIDIVIDASVVQWKKTGKYFKKLSYNW